MSRVQAVTWPPSDSYLRGLGTVETVAESSMPWIGQCSTPALSTDEAHINAARPDSAEHVRRQYAAYPKVTNAASCVAPAC